MPLTSTGFSIPTYEEIRDEILAAFVADPTLNPDGRLNVTPDSVLGVVARIVAQRELALNELMQAVYASQYLSGASGASLDLLAELVGVTRSPATNSTAVLTVTGTPGTILSAGRIVRDPLIPTVEWTTTEAVTIPGGGSTTVTAAASTTGPVAANASTLTEIVTPVAGWATVTNAADATLGTPVQSDTSLRRLIQDMFFGAGSKTSGAIRSAILAVPGVVEAFVFENPDAVTNSFGVPPHNIEAVVDAPDDPATNDAIAQAILDYKALGVGSYSATSDSGNAENANGETVAVAFSRPVPVDVYVYIRVELGVGAASTALTDIATAVAAFGDQVGIGKKVRRSRFFAPIYAIPGVVNVDRVGVSDVDAATAEANALTLVDITVPFRGKAAFDTARIVVETA